MEGQMLEGQMNEGQTSEGHATDIRSTQQGKTGLCLGIYLFLCSIII